MTKPGLTYRLDLASVPAAAIRRAIPGVGGWLASLTLLYKRLAGTPVWSKELYRSSVDLTPAGEAQWAALQATPEELERARAYREECAASHCLQIGSFVTTGLPAALGILVHKTEDGLVVTVSVEAGGPVALDVWALGTPTIVIGTEPALLPPAPGYAQGWLKDGRLEELLQATRERAAHFPNPSQPSPRREVVTPGDFQELFLKWWADHLAYWVEREYLSPAPEPEEAEPEDPEAEEKR